VQTHIAGGSSWPAQLAYVAAALFTLASGGTNLIYGWSKGTDTATSLVWAAVSVGVSIIFALSWPALIISLDRRQWARAVLVLIALLVTGTYSVSAALGSAMGGRANAAIEEKDTKDRKAKAQAAWDAAKAELDTLTAKPTTELQSLIDAAKTELAKLPATRSVAEIEASLRAARRDPYRYSCALINGSLGISCPKLDAEKARALQRERLTAKIGGWAGEMEQADQRRSEQREKAQAAMDKAATELAKNGPAKIANSDAVALASYLSALGIETTADRVNKLLVLLAVICVECGGGLALAVGMALGDGTVVGSAAVADFGKASRSAPSHPSPTAVRETLANGGEDGSVRTARSPHSPTRARLLQLIAEGKGGLRADQRSLGEALGVSATRIRQLIKELVAAGTIRVRTSSTGSLITLVEGGRA
jgi:hypothetical protein